MQDGDWAAPVALPAHPPIPHAPVDDALTLARPRSRPITARAASSVDQPSRNPELMIWPGPSYALVPIANGNGFSGRQHHGNDRQVVFAGEIQVPLVAARAAEDRPGAVFHQHEVRDPNGHEPAIERMAHAASRYRSLASLRSRSPPRLFPSPGTLRRTRGRPVGRRSGRGNRMLRRHRQEGHAEQRVRPGGVDLHLSMPSGPPANGTGCARLRCGRSTSPAWPSRGPASDPVVCSASSSAGAHWVMRKNHWASCRFSTGAPDRQPRPSTTCSLASTVSSTGSQLTQLSRRSTRPLRISDRNSFCCWP